MNKRYPDFDKIGLIFYNININININIFCLFKFRWYTDIQLRSDNIVCCMMSFNFLFSYSIFVGK